MAESVSDAGKARRPSPSLIFCGGHFFINISNDKVKLDDKTEKEVFTADSTSAQDNGCDQLRPVIENAIKPPKVDERDNQEVQDITCKQGCLHILLHCLTDERFLEVLADYETGKIKERFQEEFLQAGIKVEELKVGIENMAEVDKTKEAINKRNLCKDGEDGDERIQKDKLQNQSYTTMMQPMPRDERAFFEEATSLGLLGPNPSLEKPRAKLLECIRSSMKIRRSINHVSVLLVGTTGVGKSSTVNHLLDVDLAEISKTESQTKLTKEYIILGSYPKYEVEELPLGLIDTPGSCDTDGSKQDACNLLSVQRFFNSHPKMSKCYANLIFLVVRATDNRIKGENSELGKSLRCINHLGLVDPENPNVVIILTHVCSIRKKNNKEWVKALDEIKSLVTKIVFDDLKVSAPVVVIENEWDDCCLKQCGDYTVLPSEELQPKNLYMACASVLLNNNDSLGLIVLNSIFAKSKKGRKYPIKKGHIFKANNAKQCKLDSEERAMLKLLEIAAQGGSEDPFYTVTLDYIREQKLKGEQVEEVMKIAGVLENLGEGNPPNFGSHSIHSIEYFLGKEISSTGRKMLEEKFKIAVNPSWNLLDSGRLIGQGYNILTDKSVAAQVMKFDVTNKYGFAIPKCAKFEKVQETKSFMEVFEDEKSYTQSRLKNLNVNLAFKPGIFKMDSRAGYNKKSNSTSSSSASEYSLLFEQRLFELKLGNYRECLNHGMTFTEDFKSDVAKLPRKYDKNNPHCVSKFKRFFDRFGHFMVSSAYGGGSVEVRCSREAVKGTTTSLAEAKACLAARLEGLDVAEANFSADDGTSPNSKSKVLLKQSTFAWNGGEAALQTKETVGDKEKLKKWKKSLPLKPMMLTSELTLEPISTAVGLVGDSGKDEATYNALKDLLHGNIRTFVMKYRKLTQERLNEKRGKDTRNETVLDPDQTGTNCFPSSSVVKVQNKDGEVKQKKMANLDVGDKIMDWDEKRNQTVFTEVMMFAHLAPDAVDVKYLKITLEDGNEITLSGNHLVMAGKHKKAILARKVKPGDILFSVDENQEISPKKVLAVEKVIEQGLFCPITLSGNVIVDNVLASCYASVEDHVLLKGLVKISAQNMAHLGLMPMRALHKLRSKWLRKIPNGQTIHPYLQWLCKLELPWMVQ